MQAVSGQSSGKEWNQIADIFIPTMAISVLALVVRSLIHELRQMRVNALLALVIGQSAL